MNENELVRKFKEARRANTPLLSIASPDQLATIQLLASQANGKAAETPTIAWDIGLGFWHVNEAGLRQIASKLGGKVGVQDPNVALQMAGTFDARTILFLVNAQRFLDNTLVMQRIFNLRDQYKQDKRTLVLLGPQIKLPEELANDVVELDEPLPDDAELRRIVRRCRDGWEGCEWQLTSDDEARAAASLKGTSAFGAEQHWTMAADRDGVRWADLNASVRKTIEQTPGLRYEDGRETFADIGGLNFVKRFGERLFAGPRRPALVVRIEEIEKATRGAEGDLSGTSMDAMQVLLSWLEDNNASGAICYGCAGAGKSLFSKALANTFDVRGLILDLNACKGSLVGQSEARIREALKVIKSIGGDRVFFVASCNDVSSINTALKRRFRSGTWFFDVLSDEDRAAVWAIQRSKWQIASDDPTPDERDLTGADIRNICEQAYSLAMSLADAREFVVPLKVQDPQSIEAARAQANGRFLDANRGGTYRMGEADRPSGGRRKVKIGDE